MTGKAFLLALVCLFLFVPPALAENVLILYEDYDGPWNYGILFANMTANLVNHYGRQYRFLDVGKYLAGDMEDFDSVIYIGSIYANEVSPDFLADAAAGLRPVFWINYNLYQLIWSANFSVNWGFTYLYGVAESDFFSVEYKGRTFERLSYYPEYNRVQIDDPSRATVKAWLVSSSDPNNKVPYIVEGDGLWYCADNPFSWLTDANRYVVFADLLGEFLGYLPRFGKRAMLRFEDNAPVVSNPQVLLQIGKKMKSNGVPFALGVIPVFKDPVGEYFGAPVEYRLSDDPEFVKALKTLQSRFGATLILHGYTHQYDGVTGDDYEFWMEEINTPIPEDSAAWAQSRIDAALAECHAVGLYPDIWETPHYSASQLDYEVFYANFAKGYERTRVYNNFDSNPEFVIERNMKQASSFNSSYPRLKGAEKMTLDQIRARPFLSAGAAGSTGKEAGDEAVYVLQYVTFGVPETIYGNAWIPENMGYIEPGHVEPATLLNISQKYSVLMDPVASFFYHHDYSSTLLMEMVRGMKKQGYRFISVQELLDSMKTNSPMGFQGDFPQGASFRNR